MGADIACAIKEVFAVTPAAGSVRYPGCSCGLACFGVGSLGVVVGSPEGPREAQMSQLSPNLSQVGPMWALGAPGSPSQSSLEAPEGPQKASQKTPEKASKTVLS